MPPSVHRMIGRLVATVALASLLVANGEQYLPDDHDWHASQAGSVLANDETAPTPDFPAPAHPIHVCHGEHQHTLSRPADESPLPVWVAAISRITFPKLDPPPALAPRLVLRPPIG